MRQLKAQVSNVIDDLKKKKKTNRAFSPIFSLFLFLMYWIRFARRPDVLSALRYLTAG